MNEEMYGVTINGELYEVWGDGMLDAVCDACRFYCEDNKSSPVKSVTVEVY